MTLQNGLVADSSATIWADTLWLCPHSGSEIAQGPKIFTVSGFPSCVGMASIGGDPYQIPDMVAEYAPLGLGDLLGACEETVRRFVKEKPAIAVARLLIAGWCYETESARLFVVSSDAGPNWQPYQAAELAWFLHEQNHTQIQVAIASGLTLEKMIEIADLQHSFPFKADKGGFAPMLAIGGELTECTVTKEGTFSRVVRRFN